MKLLTITKLVIIAVLIFACYALAEHPQTLRMQQRHLENKFNRLNMPAENESRNQRVQRQLTRNQVRSELARVETQIARIQPSPSEQSARLGQLRSNTRTRADLFVNQPSGNDDRHGFRRDDDKLSGSKGTGLDFHSYQHNVRSKNHSSRVFDSGTKHHSFMSSQFRNPQVFSSVVSPHKHRTIYHRYGRHHNFSRIYPYYHKKYIFVSLNGFWPYYPYRRYYTYSCYPYYWYGYYPTAYVVGGGYGDLYSYDSGISSIDAKAYSDAQSRLDGYDKETPQETPADTYFDAAVSAFSDEQYQIAEKNIAMAIAASPDDIVLPYAMVQALFAQGKYSEAAKILRKAVKNTPTDKEGVIFARGLYSDDDKLYKKIDVLADEAGRKYYDDDLHLLLGYQYLGIGRYDDAERHLEKAKFDSINGKSAAAMIEILEDLRSAD